ncbi:hypothetical protein DLJ46_32690 [Micromonospora globispora]|uniref:Uncharacterized protein n=1 Tax=Micromonospora globispora TaxID=1450148 RepID=A0A317JVW8_9ACTN|nr:hypothetical protein [Micromonospora globispora]PWU43203.1 hypothetical protein DLJ46_32690 [Micromonospora globispora]
MTTSTPNIAAQERMTPEDYIVTNVAAHFAARGELAYQRFLAGYYAESVRLIHHAHVADCTAGPDESCATCDAIRVGLVGRLVEQRTGKEVTGHGQP